LKYGGAFYGPEIPAGGIVVETDGVSAVEAATEIFSRLGTELAGLNSAS
jgi:hypothetical protein